MKIKFNYFSLLSIPLVIIYNISDIILQLNGKPISEDNSFNNLFYSMIFEETFNKNQTTTIYLIAGLMIPVVFNLVFGSYIYSDIHISSTYYFVRQKDRKKWYINKLLNLIILTAIFVFFQIIIPFFIAIINSNENISKGKIVTVIVTYNSLLMYTLITTLLINILAIFFGSVISFIVIYFITIIFFYMSINLDNIVLWGHQIDFSIINFADNTMVPWKNSSYQLIASLLVNFIYLLVISVIGYFVVKRLDVGITNRENIV